MRSFRKKPAARWGEAETNLAMSIHDQKFVSRYDIIPAPDELAAVFGIVPTTSLLRRRFTSADPRTGNLLSDSVSYIPKVFVDANPAILDERNEPWPGGTLHQLSTVGIEIMKVVDEVTARMPSSTEADAWDLPLLGLHLRPPSALLWHIAFRLPP